jgi:hypothetical protein
MEEEVEVGAWDLAPEGEELDEVDVGSTKWSQ